MPLLCLCLLCRNTKWKFLEGVKVSGAPPPRQFIVQQCMWDLGVLEALCNYVSFFCYSFILKMIYVDWCTPAIATETKGKCGILISTSLFTTVLGVV